MLSNRDKCKLLHYYKPWIPNFEQVVITPRPEKKVDPRFLGKVIVEGEISPSFASQANLPPNIVLQWYQPTDHFWNTHCRVSHGPKDQCIQGKNESTCGSGCDVKVHDEFLGWDNPDSEFLYGYLKKGDPLTIYLENYQDFLRECLWWEHHFDSWRPPS